MERKKRRERKRKDFAFFREMEANIRASLDRGELIPNTPLAATEKEGPPKEPLALLPKPARVRTISGMNEHILAQLRDDNENTEQRGESHIPESYRPPGAPAGPPLKGRPPLPRKNSSLSSSSLDPDPFVLSPEVTSRSECLTPNAANTEVDSLQGEFLLDEPLLDESAAERLPLESSITTNSTGLARPAPLSAHIRRNTGGTLFVKSTMENPDIKATIQCVCGVYRAHIVQSAKRMSEGSPVSTNSLHIDSDVFRDDYEHHEPPRNKKHVLPIPTLHDIESFYEKFYERSQMEHDTIIMSLIYVERLIKETNGVVTPGPENWASILFSCMILAR